MSDVSKSPPALGRWPVLHDGFRGVLRFVYNDLFRIVCAADMSDELRERVESSGNVDAVFNANIGRLDLGSIYGASGLTGDVARQLMFCARHPWDLAKIRTDKNRGFLRLRNLIVGDVGVLSDSYFDGLPKHLKPLFFKDGDLWMDKAIVPDLRNVAHRSTARVHLSIVKAHNDLVDARPARNLGDQERRAVFHAHRATMVRRFQTYMQEFVLPEVCNSEIFAWSVRNNAPIYRDLVARHGQHVLPLEGAFALWFVSQSGPYTLAELDRNAPIRDWQYALPTAHALICDISERFGVDLQNNAAQLGERSGDIDLSDYFALEASGAGKTGTLGPLASLLLAETVLPALTCSTGH